MDDYQFENFKKDKINLKGSGIDSNLPTGRIENEKDSPIRFRNNLV